MPCTYVLSAKTESDEEELERARGFLDLLNDEESATSIIVLECKGEDRIYVGEVRRNADKPEPNKFKYKYFYPNWTRKDDVKESEPFEVESDHEAFEHAERQANTLNTVVEVYSFEIDEIIGVCYPDDFDPTFLHNVCNGVCGEALLDPEPPRGIDVRLNINISSTPFDGESLAETVRAIQAVL